MLKVEHSIDYLKKGRSSSETFEGAKHVKQIISQQKTLRFKRSDDNPELPENFKVGQAIGGGDCFFDSVAKGLKQLKPEMDFTVKSLREVCKRFAQSQLENDQSWLKGALRNEAEPISVYVPRIEFTADDIEQKSGSVNVLELTSPIWGRSEIEGRIICKEYNVKLHVVEKHVVEGKEVWLDQIVNSEGSRSMDSIDYNEENTIHIINRGNAHFEPILGTQEIRHNKQQSPDPSDYDDEITPEEELINIIKSRDSEEEKLARIKRLFEKEPKPDVNFQDKDKDTPLHIAIRKGKLEVIKLLLEKGAKVNDDSLRNKRNRTPLDTAKHLKRQDIVQILEPQIQPNLQASVEEQSANRQQFQENLHSGSNSGQGYNTQSSNQPKKLTQKQSAGKHSSQRRAGTTGSGDSYEIDLLILGKIRGERDADRFYLDTNVDGVGAFDDIVFRYWNEEKSTTILLQAKHVENPKKGKVTIEKFKNPKDDKFYLGKYFSDYLSIREKFNEKSKDPVFQGNSQVKYIIYTNAILDERFDKNRKIDIDNSIFSTKSKEDKDKAFKFSLDDKNSDVIETLESVSCRERIKLLAKALVSCISGKLNYNNMMGNEFFSTYHVFLAKNVIDVGEEIKEDGKKNKYREGKINHNFLNIDNEDSFKKVLKEEVLYEYAKNVIFNEKSSSGLDSVSERDVLVNKVVKSLESSKKVDEDVIEKLGGNVIILDTKNKQLKFAGQEKIKDESAKQFIRDLESKVSKLADYKFDIPYEFVKKTLKEQTEKETLKLHVSFGNISPSFKKPEHLIKKLIELFEKYKSLKIIKIDDSVVGHGKSLTDGDIKNIGKLVGNLLVFDKNKKMLKLASEESLDRDALELITKLKTTAQSHGLKVDDYRFDIKVKNFPKDTLFIDGEDRTNVEEFLSKLEVFTGQASDPELRKVIKGEIKNLYKLTEEEVEGNFLKIRNKAEEHWRKGDFYLEKGDDFFTNIFRFDIQFNVKEPVDLFSGRVEQLKKLHIALQSRGEASVSGLGGVGKSELAKKYAYDHGNDYDGNVIWINVESYQTLAESFLRLAQDKLGINVKGIEGNQKDINSIVEDVYGFFSKRKSLFIFDNAEKLRTQDDGDEGIDKFLPSLLSNANKPYILITSRNQKWGNIEVMPLGTFTEKEATDFIKKALNIEDDSQKNEIQKLMEILERFPLALTQAVAYIKQANEEVKNVEPEREFKIDDYLKEYERKTKELLNFPFPDDSDAKYSRTTFTTWKVTIDKIKKKEYGKKAMEILDIIAYCAPDNIPTKIFLKLEEYDERKLGATVQLLKRYSMVNLEGGTLSVHRLVQQVTRINLMDKKREEEILGKALELIKSYDSEEKGKSPSQCIFYPCTEDGKLSNSEKHVTYIWSYASKYGQLIKDFYSTYGEKANTPINLFAINGKKEAIESILKNIEKGKLIDKINEYNEIGYAPIHSAAFNGHKETVKYLIEKQGVDIDFITRGSENTPTFIAVLGNQLDVVQYLVGRGADPNKGGKCGSFPIHYAALYARKDLIECLINNNANILLKDKLSGNNVLHYALLHLGECRNHLSDTEEIVKYFLEKNSVLEKDANFFGMTPLHFAAESGSARIVKMLLDYGANVNAKSHLAKPQLSDVSDAEVDSIKEKMFVARNVKNYDEGYTPLHIAAKENHLENVKLLLQKGAIYSAINDERSTPLCMAELGSDVENLLASINKSFQATKKNQKNELDSLLKGRDSDELKAILHARNRNQKTLLQFAIANEQKDIEKVIIEKLRLIQSSDQQQEAVKQGVKVSAKECLPSTSSGRRKREAIGEKCLFTWEDVDEFNEEKDEKRDLSKIKIDSEKFVSYIKDLPKGKQSQLIQLAGEAQVTGRFQGLVNKLTSNQKVISHLNRVGKISGMTMHGMMAKNVLADFLNGDYQGVAINVGFIAGGQGFAKVAEAASIKGLKLASEGKLLLGRSLRAASPFLARGTSAFVVYDLVNQVKAFKNGTEEALVGVVGDSIYLGVDAAEIGVEVAEAFGVLEGVSSVTGPIGAAIGAVVFVGTDVYMAVKRVDKIDQLIHLTGKEKFIEGLRAFIGMQPENHIQELLQEKEVSNELVRQGLEYLNKHSDIQSYVFPTGKSVVDSCRKVPYQVSDCASGGFGGGCLRGSTVTRYAEECTTKFEVDLDNKVILDKKRTDIKWSRARPDNPSSGKLFCLPRGNNEPVPNYGSYLCENAIGLSTEKKENYTLIDLGKGDDYSKGFLNSPNIFVVNNGSKEYYGGNKDDIFVLQAGYVKGYLSGEGGINTLDTTSFAFQEEPLNIQLDIGEIVDYSRDNWLRVCDINKVIGRKNRAETITVSCNGCNSNVKLIDGQSGNKEIKDKINIVDNHCSYQMQVIVRPNTVIYNRALEGNFDYLVPLNEGGSAEFIFIFGPERFNVNNTFWFGYEPVDIKSINVRYVNIFNRTEHEVKFNFIKSEKEFNVTIPYAENPSYRLGKNGEIKIGNKDNLYMLQSSNESSEEIIKNYLPLASRLNKMSFFIQSLLSNETVVIGSGNHEVIHNNPAYRSHLVGNGGENVYVIDSESKKFEVAIPEVIIYDLDIESSVDTIDLRNLVRQVRGKLSNQDHFQLKVLKSANDLLLKATIVEVKPTEDSSVSKMRKHEYCTVRLKDGVNWYNKTHVIVDNAPMKINLDNNEWSLKPLPLKFEKDKEVIIVTSQDIEENTELITPKRAGNYSFVSDHGNDLIVTNAFDVNVAKNDLCTIVLSKFYEKPKMATLSIKFADKEIILKEHQEEISTARDVNVMKKEHKDQVYNGVFNHTKSSPEVIMLSDQPVTHRHRHSGHREQTRHRRSTSSGIRPTGWINDLFGWVRSSISGLLSSKPESTPSSISQVDARVDVNGTIMLLDVFIRKVTGQKYVSTVDHSISPLEAQGYALNITNRFEKVLNKTAIKSGISVTNLNFDPVVVQSAIIEKIINGKFSEIAKTLYSFAKEACPEFKQTDKFLDNLKSNLEEVLAKEETMILQQKVEKPYKDLSQEVSRKVQLSKKPDTFLNGTSVVQGISRAIN